MSMYTHMVWIFQLMFFISSMSIMLYLVMIPHPCRYHGRTLQCAMGVPPHAYAGTYLHYIDAAVVAECGNLNGGQTSMGTI